MGIEFVDAQKMHKEDPEKFKVPSKSALLRIKKDDNVKVCTGSERFWVTVAQVEGDHITGYVNNDLNNIDKHGLSLGDPVEFQTCHVYDINEF